MVTAADKPKPVKTPEGVELYDWGDHSKFRSLLFDGVRDEFAKNFPQAYGGVRMEVNDLHYRDPEEYDGHAEKDALLRDKFLSRRLAGTVSLFDDKTNELLDSRPMTLMRVPYLTDRGSIIHNGSEYTLINQSRLLPGAYSRRQDNGELETQFNARTGTGPAMRVGFVPQTAQYYLRVGGSNLHFYSLLRELGVEDDTLRKIWGDHVFAANQDKYDPRVLSRAFEKLVRAKNKHGVDAKNLDQVRTAVSDAISSFQIQERVARRNLPTLFDRTKAAEWQVRKIARDLVDSQLGEGFSDYGD